MPASSSTRLDTLPPDLAGVVERDRARWDRLRISTAPCDRTAAERGVALAYEAAGLEVPHRIVWCAGPLELAQAWQASRYDQKVGPNVRDLVVDQARERAARQIRNLLGAQARRALLDEPRSTTDNLMVEVVLAVARQARRTHPRVTRRIGRFVAALARFRRPSRGWASFSRSSIGGLELGWLWPWEFLHARLGVDLSQQGLGGLHLLASSMGWMLPHQQICWLSERPTTLSQDIRGRLHGTRGPALAYGDGFRHYAWKGIEVPQDFIEDREGITLEAIDHEPDPILRRTMIDIITPQRFVAMGGAIRASQDDTGVLWRRTWWTGDSWAAVEVVNGTRQPDGSREHYYLQVPPELRTAREAVAWTYGMSEQRYSDLVLRT